MSEYVNPNLQKHKLDVLAKYFSLGDFNHHRASDDAKMLSAIFYKMVDKCFDEGIRDLEAMNKAMSEKADPLKLRTYHQIIICQESGRAEKSLPSRFGFVSEILPTPSENPAYSA